MKSFLVYCIVLLMCLCAAEVFCTETCDTEGTNGAKQCTPKVKDYLVQITRDLYQDEFLPEQTRMINDVKTKFEDKLEENEQLIDDKLNSLKEDLKAHFDIQISQLKATIAEANRKIIFTAVRSTSGSMKATSTITFDEASLNIGGGMSPDTGHFKAPVSGIYTFSFRALTEYEARTSIKVLKNGEIQFYLFENNHEGYDSHELITSTWNMDLTKDDEISFVLNEGGLYVSWGHPVLFSGHLLMQRQ